MAIDKDVLHLIFVTEKIEAAPLKGKTYSAEEATLIRECAKELLEAVPDPMPDESLLLPFLI
jgi:hypothetical protein